MFLLQFHEYITVHWPYALEVCLFANHLFYTSLALSVFTQTAMALER